MQEILLKYSLGTFIVVGHLVVVVLIAMFYALSAFSFQQTTSLIATVVPGLAVFTTAVISFIVSDRYRKIFKSRRVTTVFAAFSFILPGVFFIAIVSAIWAQAYGLVFANFEQFRSILVLIETVFGAYMGRFIFALFDRVGGAGVETEKAIKTG